MYPNSVIAISIAFVSMGIVFCTFSLLIGKGAKDAPHDTSFLSKTGGIIFFIIGFVTVIVGLFGAIYHNEATKAAIQTVALIYILLLLILLIIFAALMKVNNKKERK